jgi:hypothetical protein
MNSLSLDLKEMKLQNIINALQMENIHSFARLWERLFKHFIPLNVKQF